MPVEADLLLLQVQQWAHARCEGLRLTCARQRDELLCADMPVAEADAFVATNMQRIELDTAKLCIAPLPPYTAKDVRRRFVDTLARIRDEALERDRCARADLATLMSDAATQE